MSEELHQGDILKIEHIKKPVLVVSKDFFNQTYEIIGCPIYEKEKQGHYIYISRQMMLKDMYSVKK